MRTALAGFIMGALFLAASLAAEQARWSDDFSGPKLDGWHLPLPADWSRVDSGGSGVLRLEKGEPIGNPRRPVKFALFEPGCVSDFEVETRIRRFGRSMLVAFGFQDRAHFYYAHVSGDDGSHRVHNGIFKVDGGERFRIAGEGSAAALPTEDWHRIRVVREAASGKIEVYADDDPKPRFAVVDESFRYGWVGLGSFNETGEFDDFELRGVVSKECRPELISPLDAP